MTGQKNIDNSQEKNTNQKLLKSSQTIKEMHINILAHVIECTRLEEKNLKIMKQQLLKRKDESAGGHGYSGWYWAESSDPEQCTHLTFQQARF